MKPVAFINAFTIFAAFLISTSALAEKSTKSATTSPSATIQSISKSVFVKNIAPEAIDAVKVVDAFSEALKAANFDNVKQLLDDKVLILESGGSERSRVEYMSEHALADAMFLRKAKSQLRYRQAHAEGSFAWVATESELQSEDNGKPLLLLSTETMLLKNSPQGWKIVHIHWSSHSVVKE